MNISGRVEHTIISAQISEIRAQIGNRQLTLAATSLMDFVDNFAQASPEYSRLSRSVVELKSRIGWFQRAVVNNLPIPEPYDALESGMLDLLEKIGAAAQLPSRVREASEIIEKLDETVAEEARVASAENRRLTADKLRDTLTEVTVASYASGRPAVRIDNAQLRYPGGDFSLGPVSMDLVPGRITGVVGMNSSGKTTLLELICGTIKPDAGSVTYPLLESEPRKYFGVRARIAYVRQSSERWSGMLRMNLNYTAAAYGVKGKANEALVDRLVTRYGLAELQHKTWSSISGGMKTRFELVRALLTQPDVLVLDEPLAYLDIITQQIFLYDLRKIAQLQARPPAVLITSQHLYEIEQIAHNMVILDDGHCLFSGAVAQFCNHDTEKVYEVAVQATEHEILERLTPHGLSRIEPTALGQILFFNRDAEDAAVRSALVHEFAGNLGYFRDVSKSTRRLFRNSHDDFDSPPAPNRGEQ